MRPALLLCILPLAIQAQTTRPKPTADPQAAPLPISRVSLYKNGVGFFEHSGRVSGNASVTIDFTTAQLNDVLQSLTAIDLGGGRIAGAGYNSTTPVDQQLRSLPIALGPDADSTAFYNAIRGARVEVRSGTLAITGRLLSIEIRTVPPREDSATQTASAAEKRFLTVVSDAGTVRTLELTPATEVRLLDAALTADVARYLQLLAATRSSGLRHLTLQDNGTGTRDLRVSYISEVPIWKSTYRILFTGASGTAGAKQTATLQGWSVVDNTTGSDWLNVQLSLIAGAPQSFIQPISTPYYSRRPEIPLPQEAQLSPQTHASGDSAVTGGSIAGNVTDPSGAVISGAQVTAVHLASGARVFATTGADGSFNLPVQQGGAYRVDVSASGFQMTSQQIDTAGGAASLNIQLHIGAASETVSLNALSIGGPSASNFVSGKRALPIAGVAGMFAPVAAAPMIPYEQAASNSIAPDTTTRAFDDFFAYTIAQPVTIRKNESALVPILQTPIDAERVTLWSPAQPAPLRALWITNTSNLTLDRGSFAIVEDGAFGGEGLLDPIHPAERRLLSYAADQAIRVSTDFANNTRRVQHITVAKGVLKETIAEVSEVEYLVKNAAPDPRTVIVEHLVRPGWKLDSDPKPTETTPTTYRFRVETKPSETVRLHIGERHILDQTYQLLATSGDQLGLILRNANVTPAFLAQLEPVFAARRAVADIDIQINAKESTVNSITEDQKRLRDNLSALKASAEERALVKRYTTELNTQEDQLATLARDLTTLRAQRQSAQADLENKIANLNLDVAL